jgi:tetratricopeptide (TPR) repeat protein
MIDLEQAKHELAKVPLSDERSSNEERLRLLLLYSKDFYRQNPKQAEKWARESLKLATKLKDAEGVARAYHHLGRAQYQLCDYAHAAASFQKAIDLDNTEQFRNPLLEGPVFSLGLVLAKEGKYTEALNFYERALRMSREYHKNSDVDILGAMGNAALEQGDYPKALKYQYESLAILDTIDDPLRRSVVLSSIAWIYYEVRDIDKADYFLERSYLIGKEISDVSGVISALYNRAIIASKRGNIEVARKLYQETFQLALSIGRKESEAYVEDSLGVIELDERNPKVALKHFNRAIEIATELNLRTIWCASLIGKGRTFVAMKNPAEAIQPLKDSLHMSEESGLLPLQCESTSALASAYEAAGKLKESIQYFNKFIALNAEVHNEQKQRTLVEISARVEIEKADRERSRMEKLAKDADGRAELLRSETERQSKELTTLALQLVQKNEFLCNLKVEIEPAIKSRRKAKKITQQIDTHIKSDRDWETFEHQFDQVHGEFLKRLVASFPSLTPTEMKIAALVKLNLPTKAMSNLLCLSTRTVENHRMSIRRKVGLGAEDNLVSFLTGFGEGK